MQRKNKKFDAALPIDFVVLWVDGNDPEWQREHRKYSPARETYALDNSVVRYRDWDNMQYWFRAVETFAPWVRTVHFVTWGHLPDFLDPNAPKLHIVNHRDFIQEECLPLFNSTAIEVNIHKIPGLAEQFVFFNDDMFLTAPVSPEDFFRHGLPCDTLTEVPIPAVGEKSAFCHHVLNDIGAVNRNFQKRKQLKNHPFCYINWRYGVRTQHLAEPYLKSSWERIWQKESQVLEETCHARFRTNYDVNQHLFKFWRLAEGEFYPVNRKGMLYPVHRQSIDGICQDLAGHKYAHVCFNDSAADEDFELCKAKLNQALKTLLPNKSSFEK